MYIGICRELNRHTNRYIVICLLIYIPFPGQNETSGFQRGNKNIQNGTSAIKNDISSFNNGINNLTVEN